MTALVWDNVGERFFDTGIDRGVLYPRNGPAVVWNGLTGISETVEREVKSYWMDGIKYLDHYVPGAYAAKVDAYTYPEVLEGLTGTEQYAPGVYLHDQRAEVFHLSYRTGVGSDLDQHLGYKLHIIYNVMAVPATVTLATVGANVAPATFSWNLSGTPSPMFGAHPTSHISLHSRFIDSNSLETVETLLYGSEGTNPSLPSLVELLTLIEGA